MHFFEALRDPLPIHGDARRTPLLLLRIETWIRLVSMVISLVLLAFIPMFMDWIMKSSGVEEHDWERMRSFMIVVMYMIGIFSALIWVAFQFWLSYVAEQIKLRRATAKGALFAYGLVVAILSGLGILGALFNGLGAAAATSGSSFSINLSNLPMSIALLVFGIIYAKTSQSPEFEEALES